MPLAMGLRTSEDWRSSRTPRRYMLQTVITPTAATANLNILGLRKLAANPDVYISRLRVHIFHNAAITAHTATGWKRATNVAAGSQITVADIPKCDTSAGTATLEVRTGAVTGTEANQYALSHPAAANLVASIGGDYVDDWTARDLSERIRLQADEGMILELITASDTDLRIHVLVVWEEVS